MDNTHVTILELLKEIINLFDQITLRYLKSSPQDNREIALSYCCATLNYVKEIILPIENFMNLSDVSFDVLFRSIIESMVKAICVSKDIRILWRLAKDDLKMHIELGEYILTNRNRYSLDYSEEDFSKIRDSLKRDKKNLTHNYLESLETLQGETQELFKMASNFLNLPEWQNYYYEIFKINSIRVHPSTPIFNLSSNGNNRQRGKHLLPFFLVQFLTYLNEYYHLDHDSQIQVLQERSKFLAGVRII